MRISLPSNSFRRQRRQPVGAQPPRYASYTSAECPPLPLHEVRILAITERDGRVLLTVVEVSRGAPAREFRLRAAGASPGLIAQVEGWRAHSFVLLLITEDHERWELLAPDGTTTGLRVLEVPA